jgi:glycosyltransferase involved in cell wall biosynthesis
MQKIAFVTTCKGRLHHLEQTLPRMLAEHPSQVIVVDYGCPHGAGNWTERNFPEATVVRVADDPEFSAPRARNLGAQAARADWLVFIDADVLIEPGWLSWMSDNLEQGFFYRASPVGKSRDLETYGTVICARADFERAGGYDEAFRGWGGDDDDFYLALKRRGVAERNYPHAYVTAIRHGDDERAGWGDMRDRNQAHAVHQCYLAAKLRFEDARQDDRPLPLELRKQLMAATSGALRDWYAGGAEEPLELCFVLSRGPGRWLPEPLQMQTEVRFVMHVRNRLRTS